MTIQRVPCRPFWMDTSQRNHRITPACPQSKTDYLQLTVHGYTRSPWMDWDLKNGHFMTFQDMVQNMTIFSSTFNTVLQRLYDIIFKASLKASCLWSHTFSFFCKQWLRGVRGPWENLWRHFKYLKLPLFKCSCIAFRRLRWYNTE